MELAQDSFFISDSLRELFDEQTLIENSMSIDAQDSDKVNLIAGFVSLSLADSELTVSVSPTVAKALLKNGSTTFVFSFMDEKWELTSDKMRLRQMNDSKFHATLNIVGMQ